MGDAEHAHVGQVLVAPEDVTGGSRALRRLATEAGLSISFEVFEWPDDRGDPAEVLARTVEERTYCVSVEDVDPRREEVARATAEVKIRGKEPGA